MVDARPILPFSGVKVLDFTRLAPGPYCTMLLADLGAEVFAVDNGATAVADLSRGKKFINLDLKSEAGRTALEALARQVDVVVEGFRPGAAVRIGASYEQLSRLNPTLVYCSLTGYGQDGPRALEPGHDLNYLAVSGILGATGPAGAEPVWPLNLMADLAAGGMLAAFGIAGGLFNRAQTGRGCYIDAAMVDGCFSMLAMHVPVWRTPAMPRRGEGLIAGSAPYYRCYTCADGRHVAVGALERKFFENLWNALQLGEVPAQDDPSLWPQATRLLADRFATKPRDEWVSLLADKDCCVSPVLDPFEAALDAQLQSRHGQTLPRAPVIPRFGSAAPNVPPTDLSDRTAEVLRSAGVDEAAVAAVLATPSPKGAGFLWPPSLKENS
jgi:alpha-methylacyl-CoA racemase